MKPLDIITCVDFGYRFAWAERRYLLRLAAVPMAVKAVCIIAVMTLGWDQDYIRNALVMLPGYFTEGWMLSHAVRLVFHGQRWPFQPTGDAGRDNAVLNDRAYGIMTGTIFYVLAQFLMGGVLAITTAARTSAEAKLAAGQGDTSGLMFFAVLALFWLCVWAARFGFLYILAAAGIDLNVIVRAKNAIAMSVQMLLIWLVSFIPCMMLAVFVSMLLVPSNIPIADVSLGARIILLVVRVLLEVVVGIVGTASVAWGLRKLVEKKTASG